MPAPDAPPSGHDRSTHIVGSFWLPVLGTVTSLSVVAGASTSIGAWRDMSVMRESMNTLIKNSDIQQKRLEQVVQQLQEHEIRLTRGKL